MRILTRTLEASWAEHVSFQHEVIFPILLAHHARRVSEAVDLLRSDHAALSQRHAGVGKLLASMLHGRPGDAAEIMRCSEPPSSAVPPQGRRRTRTVAAGDVQRRGETLGVGWAMTRPKSRFPLNLLRAKGRSLRPPARPALMAR